MVWYDTSDLRTRPDKSTGAIAAYDRNELSAEALLRELGLSLDDLPSEEEKREKILLSVARGAPSLAPIMLAELGYLSEQVTSVSIDQERETPIEIGPGDQPPSEPDSQGAPDTNPEAINASLLAACDVIVIRALEKAGTRLKSAAGKNVAGGAASVPCDNPATLHTTLNATLYANPVKLLDKAWTLIPAIAERHNWDSRELENRLHIYTLNLITDGEAHTYERLREILAV
jgi:organic hydroperoxide reductase OsmC/OhrA